MYLSKRDRDRASRIRKAISDLSSYTWYAQDPSVLHVSFLAQIPDKGLKQSELEKFLKEEHNNVNS